MSQDKAAAGGEARQDLPIIDTSDATRAAMLRGFMTRVSAAQHAHNPDMRVPCSPGCLVCGALWCPHGNAKHYSADGCPDCHANTAEDDGDKFTRTIKAPRTDITRTEMRRAMEAAIVTLGGVCTDPITHALGNAAHAAAAKLRQVAPPAAGADMIGRRMVAWLGQALGRTPTTEDIDRFRLGLDRSLMREMVAYIMEPPPAVDVSEVSPPLQFISKYHAIKAKHFDRIAQLVGADGEPLDESVARIVQERDDALAEAARRYDCHGGPGTTDPACRACVTCLLRDLDAREAEVKRQNGSLSRAEVMVKGLEEQLAHVRRLIQGWLDQQSHERCWYYPAVFRALADLLGIVATLPPNLPVLVEFQEGCRRYQSEEYRLPFAPSRGAVAILGAAAVTCAASASIPAREGEKASKQP